MRKYTSPRLLIPNSLSFPPLECCLGTNPSHADNCLPLSKFVALPIDAIKAVAVIKPRPGIVVNR
nr:hypothetical protein [Rickettsia felis]